MITISKLNLLGQETFRYTGEVLERGATWVRLEAPFRGADRDAGYVMFRQGDRFIEWHYTDRWYNIFEIHDVLDDQLKGWYCNIAQPATFDGDTIRSIDLALDLFVDPAGHITVLDEDELAALPIDDEMRRKVWKTADALRARVERREPPFHLIK